MKPAFLQVDQIPSVRNGFNQRKEEKLHSIKPPNNNTQNATIGLVKRNHILIKQPNNTTHNATIGSVKTKTKSHSPNTAIKREIALYQTAK